MQVVILCGGRGMRFQEKTQWMPKVLVEIGGQPILWHIMRRYAVFGYTDFILCLGYLGHEVYEFFFKRGHLVDDRRSVQNGIEILYYPDNSAQTWRVTCLDTGLDTQTGARIRQVAPLIEGDPFFATYGDGLADVDLRALLAFHSHHGHTATLTAVNPVSQFGLLDIEGDGVVTSFREKPRLKEWVNGGFFVFSRAIFAFLNEDDALEQRPFQSLAKERRIMAYRHEGFWACMDTYKDMLTLDSLCRSGEAPWARLGG